MKKISGSREIESDEAGSRGSHTDSNNVNNEAETLVPCKGLAVRHHREMFLADTKHTRGSALADRRQEFDPRTTTCDDLQYSGEVPIATLPPSLPFPEELDVDGRVRGDDRNRSSPVDDDKNESKRTSSGHDGNDADTKDRRGVKSWRGNEKDDDESSKK